MIQKTFYPLILISIKWTTFTHEILHVKNSNNEKRLLWNTWLMETAMLIRPIVKSFSGRKGFVRTKKV